MATHHQRKTDDDSDDDDFTCIEPHSYGVLPSGNVLVGDSGERESCSPARLMLPDEMWQQVLQFCDGVALAQVVQTCRNLYVAGHVPELWRDLVLRDHENAPSAVVIDCFENNWKDTFVQKHVGKLSCPHVPMVVGGVFSDFHYRAHLCRSFHIPSSWLTATTAKNADSWHVECVHEPLTVEEFLTRYEKPNKPVVLKGVAKSWRAMNRWNENEDNKNHLASATRGKTFRATSGAAPLPANFSIRAYADYCSSPLLEEAPLYLFDRTALVSDNPGDNGEDAPCLRDDFMKDLKRTCPYWSSGSSSSDHDDDNPHCHYDLFRHLGTKVRPDHIWLICGPKRSGSAFHVDPNATHAWNAAICGRKRWIFYPPGVTPPGVFPSSDGDAVAMPISIAEWLLNYYYQEHAPRMKNAAAVSAAASSSSGARVNDCLCPLECTVEPGDVIFVPHGWWHAVVNLDDWNVAITHNYVSGASNLATVLRFLEFRQDQISGCRDRVDENACQPCFLKDALEQALLAHGLQDMLTRAQKEAAEGWPCRAWTDEHDINSERRRSKALGRCQRRKRLRQTTKTITTAAGPAAGSSIGGGGSIMSKAKKRKNDTNGGAFTFSFL